MASGDAAMYAQPVSTGRTEHYSYIERSNPSGVNLATTSVQRNNPNNLLAGGVVVEERVVDIEELMVTGRLVQTEEVRDQLYRSTAQHMVGLPAVPVTEIITPTLYADYVPLEVPDMPTPVMYDDYGPVEYVTEEIYSGSG